MQTGLRKTFCCQYRSSNGIKAQPQKINGATLYKALVFIDWTLDIEYKRRKPGGGIPHGRPE